ncbi:uncharacterized protein LOC127842276 [Dreissena polymorpha]|uniref:uncharacterized protein LOC127842276 n=1 Tax=Dreissena polymorpha TaxID=45954 RepID=UPI0022646BF8|nr:uncharacterized protein LOC127842276 [Dreissena polymorpha]
MIDMGMSNAERQKRWRERRDEDPDKRQRFLQKCKERYQREKQSGKRKPVTLMTEREKRSARKQWREKKRKDREREREAKRALQNIHTPPSSPEQQPENREKSRQYKQSQKKSMREKAKVYRENKALKTEIESLKKKVSMYKKRYERQKHDTPETPRKAVKRLFRTSNKKQLKKSLLEYRVLVEALRKKYAQKRARDKRDISKILCEQTLKKYKMKIEMYESVGCKTRFRKSKTCYNTRTKRIAEKVHTFYTRDDNSRLVTGIKQTKTYKKAKKQRRVLLYDLKTLHKKFHTEGKTKLSYSAFCKMRPFYVVFPRKSDRDTCMCKICNNTELLVDALNRVKKRDRETPSSYVQQLVCSEKNQNCMESKCSKCKDYTIDIDRNLRDKDVNWYEWRTTSERRQIKKGTEIEEKEVHVTSKQKHTGTVDDLMDKINTQIRRYASHIYRMYTQYNYYSMKKNSLSDNEAILHIDFSENFECGYGKEIQSVHFGASKKQITLHTGMIFLNNNIPKSFCTVSDSLCHGPEAVWAHINPILTEIKKTNPKVTKLEIFSDGPVTQYRQKGNFYLTSIRGKELGFRSLNWSFFEASHGKGAPDAIGGAIKRRANNALKYGHDITSAKVFIDKLCEESKVKMFLITEQSIEDMAKCLKDVNLKTIPGTLNIHQVICEPNDAGEIYFRKLSCFCERNHEHEGHKFDKAVLIELKDKKHTNSVNRVKKDNNTDQTKKTESKHVFDKDKEETCHTRKRKMCDSTKEIVPEKKRLVVKSFQSWIKNGSTDIHSKKSKTDESILTGIDKCKTFQALKRKVSDVQEIVKSCIPQDVCLYDNKLEVDFESVVDIPNDINLPHGVKDLYPVKVRMDGNCLPSCGSVFAYGTPERCNELRSQIVKELTQNENFYLNDTNLQQGLGSNHRVRSLSSQFAQYSEYFIPGMNLNATIIRDIYRKETLSVTKDQAYMGIWQIFALASVIQTPIRSVYPQKGNVNVRHDLNRLILPRTQTSSEPVHIMWTSTRQDLLLEHWIPNHFVPLVPFTTPDKDCETTAEVNRTVESEQPDTCDTDTNTVNETLPNSKNECNETEKTSADVNRKEKSEKPETCDTDILKETLPKAMNDCNKTEKTAGEVKTKVESEKPKPCDTDIVKETLQNAKNDCIKTDKTTAEVNRKEESERPEICDTDLLKATLPNTKDECNETEKTTADVNRTVESENLETCDTDTLKETLQNAKNDCNKPKKTIAKVNKTGESEKAETCDTDSLNETLQNTNNECNSTVNTKAETERCSINETNNINKLTNQLIKEGKLDTKDNVSNTESLPDDNVDKTEKEIQFEKPDMKHLLSKYVIVNFKGKPYPGKVINILDTDVEVVCMKQTGKKNENSFYWPKAIKDISWYDYDEVVTTIPKPRQVRKTNRFEIEENTWNKMKRDKGSLEEASSESNKLNPIDLGKPEETLADRHSLEEKNEYVDSKKSETDNIYIDKKESGTHMENEYSVDEFDETSGRMIDENANEVKSEFPDMKDILNKYVIVNFNGRPYPGKVIDVDEEVVEVTCMHQVGKKNSNCFYWPKLVKDISWYDYDQILTVIPEPKPIGNTNQYKVDEFIWNESQNKTL